MSRHGTLTQTDWLLSRFHLSDQTSRVDPLLFSAIFTHSEWSTYNPRGFKYQNLLSMVIHLPARLVCAQQQGLWLASHTAPMHPQINRRWLKVYRFWFQNSWLCNVTFRIKITIKIVIGTCTYNYFGGKIEVENQCVSTVQGSMFLSSKNGWAWAIGVSSMYNNAMTTCSLVGQPTST